MDPAAVLSVLQEQEAVLGYGNCGTEENLGVHHHPHNEMQLDRCLLQPED